MELKKQQRRIGCNLTMIIVLVISSIPMTSQAETVTWIGGSSRWDIDSNWDTGTQPAAYDVIFLTQSDAINRTVDYYNTLFTDPLNPWNFFDYLEIDATSTGSMTLNQTSYAHILNTMYETVGDSGTGAHIQSFGTNSSKILYLGYSATGSGSYTLSDTGSLITDTAILGRYGAGVFTQAGGSYTVATDLTIGQYSGSKGAYTLSGGTLDVGRDIVNGVGTSNLIINGGTLNVVGNLGVDTLVLGSSAGTSGKYTLVGTSAVATDSEIVGNEGSGSFIQTGGSHRVGSTLTLGSSRTGSGTYNLSAGNLYVSDREHIGFDGSGVFTQTGGSHKADYLYLGFNSKGSGRYNLNGGELSVRLNEYVGVNGVGIFVQNGVSTNTIYNLYLGLTTTGNGDYDLGGGALQAGREMIGHNGTGTFIHDGGTNTLRNDLILGNEATGRGSYKLRAGELVAENERIGYKGAGIFKQTGGTNTVRNELFIGRSSLDSSSYELNDGALRANSVAINNGLFTQTGGANTSVVLTVGAYTITSGSSRYNLNSGELLIRNEFIGNFGSGIFTQTGGTHTVTDNLTVGRYESGSYNLSGTSVLSVGTETIGYTGTGTFNQTGGIHAVTNDLTLGQGTRSNGTYTLSGGTLNVGGDIVNGSIYGTSTLNINGGTLNVSGGDVDVDYLNLGEAGYLVSNMGDNWFISGDFTNNSLQNTLWDTSKASLILNGSGSQNLYLASADQGVGIGGYNDNFSWGMFSLGSGINLSIWDSNGGGNAAFYVGLVSLADGVDLGTLYIDYILSDYNIYYNPLLAENSYLNGLAFALNGSGYLMPSVVPVPPAIWLFGFGLLGLFGVAKCKVHA